MCKGPGAGMSYQPSLLLPAAYYIPALVATLLPSFLGVGQFQPTMYSLNKTSALSWVPGTHTCLRYCPVQEGRTQCLREGRVQLGLLIMRHFFCA